MNRHQPEHYPEINELAHRRYELSRRLGSLILAHEARKEWFSRRLLFVTGPHASGKSTAVHHAFDGVCGIHDLGPIIRDTYSKEANDIHFGEWIKNGEKELGTDFTNDILVRHLRPELETPKLAGTVLVGSRSARGIQYLVNHLQPSDHKVLYIEASDEVLFSRFQSRPKSVGSTKEQFRAALQAEQEMGLGSVKTIADCVISNNGELEPVVNDLQEVILSWQPEVN